MSLAEVIAVFGIIYECCAPLAHIPSWADVGPRKSVDLCRRQLEKCFLDDKNPLEKCLRSMNLATK